jgi:alanine racemase
MDMTMVDVTDLPEVETSDEVVLIGTQDKNTITAEEVAVWADTINYEIYCALSHRVPRYYLDGQ